MCDMLGEHGDLYGGNSKNYRADSQSLPYLPKHHPQARGPRLGGAGRGWLKPCGPQAHWRQEFFLFVFLAVSHDLHVPCSSIQPR